MWLEREWYSAIAVSPSAVLECESQLPFQLENETLKQNGLLFIETTISDILDQFWHSNIVFFFRSKEKTLAFFFFARIFEFFLTFHWSRESFPSGHATSPQCRQEALCIQDESSSTIDPFPLRQRLAEAACLIPRRPRSLVSHLPLQRLSLPPVSLLSFNRGQESRHAVNG